MKTTKTSRKPAVKYDLIIVLSPMPQLGHGIRSRCNSEGRIRTFEHIDDPR